MTSACLENKGSLVGMYSFNSGLAIAYVGVDEEVQEAQEAAACCLSSRQAVSCFCLSLHLPLPLLPVHYLSPPAML